MLQRHTYICLSAILLLLALQGCRKRVPGGYFGDPRAHPERARTLTFGNGAEPEYLDPGLASESSGTEIARNLWEGLTEYDPVTLDPTPGVAESWQVSEDATTYSFRLRKNARWSNGEPVTARDFHWSWIRVLTPSTLSQYADMLHTFVVNARGFYHRTTLVAAEGGAPLTATAAANSASRGRIEAGAWVEVVACDMATLKARIPAIQADPLPGSEARLQRKDPTTPPHELRFQASEQRLRMRSIPEEQRPIKILQWDPRPVKVGGAEAHWVRIEARGAGKLRGWVLDQFLERDPKVGRCMIRQIPQRYDPDPGPATPEPVAATPPQPAPTPTQRAEGVATASGQADAVGEGALVPTPTPTPQPVATSPTLASGWVARDRLVIDAKVVGIEVPDDHTLIVHLKHPVPFFLELMSWVTFRPAYRPAVEAHGKHWTRPGNIVCNGPFVLTDWHVQYQLVLEPNPYYWEREVIRLDKVVALSIDNNHAVINLYEAGEIDWTGPGTSLPSEYMDHLKTKEDFTTTPYLGSYYYWVNVNAEPVNDYRVRQALGLTIDREKIVKHITRAGQIPASHLVPAGLGGYVPAEGPRFDPEKARRLLSEAGYPGGKGLAPIELIYNTSEGHRKVAEAIQQMWKDQLGIEVSITNQEWKVFLKNLQYQFYQVGRMGWIGDYRDPHTFLSLLVTDGGHNYGDYRNADYDALLDKALRTRDKTTRLALYRKAEELAMRDLPVLPIYTYTRQWLNKPYVRGIFPNDRDMHPFKWLWLDESWAPGKAFGPDPDGRLKRHQSGGK